VIGPARRRALLFVATVVAIAALGVGYSAYALMRSHAEVRPTAGTRADRALSVSALLDRPHIVFRSTSLGPTYGLMTVVALDDPDGPRAATGTACERAYSVGTTGVCMSADRGVITTYHTQLLDSRLRLTRELDNSGIPSRARLSADGRLAATTTFVTGHSYSQTGFSTVTTIYETATGRSLGSLEKFTIIRDGKAYRSSDVNVWGVTFTADPDRFYATVGTKGTTYLVQGDLAARTLRTVRENVECPSLSPDGKRLAYKHREEGSGAAHWRLHVLDLASGHDVALAESRNVDDQAAWLDDDRVIYGLPRDESAETDVWVVPADGTGSPAVLIPRAWSPAVVR
jgi:hypothetical protein